MQFPERYESAVASEYFQASHHVTTPPKVAATFCRIKMERTCGKFAWSLFEDRIRSWDELEIPNLDLLVRCLENISNIPQQMVVSDGDFPSHGAIRKNHQPNKSKPRIPKNPKNHSQGSLGIPKQIQANKQIQAKKGGAHGGTVIPVSLRMLATPPSQRVGLGLDRSPRTNQISWWLYSCGIHGILCWGGGTWITP